MQITKLKKAIWNAYTLYDFNYISIGKGQNYRYHKRSVVARVRMENGLNRQSTEDFESRKTILHDSTMVERLLYFLFKPTECTTLRVNSNVNYGVWVIMVCQCELINYNTCATLVGGGYQNGGGCTCIGTGVMQEFSILSAVNFAVNIKLL
jgi:hypothetical protein